MHTDAFATLLQTLATLAAMLALASYVLLRPCAQARSPGKG
ncbi:hypothetical protein [Marilutibacter maris]|nr:hypothetical protein [Lysobacter maris]